MISFFQEVIFSVSRELELHVKHVQYTGCLSPVDKKKIYRYFKCEILKTGVEFE